MRRVLNKFAKFYLFVSAIENSIPIEVVHLEKQLRRTIRFKKGFGKRNFDFGKKIFEHQVANEFGLEIQILTKKLHFRKLNFQISIFQNVSFNYSDDLV